MQKPEPIIVPPRVRIPQISPRVITQRRLGYFVPTPHSPSAAPLPCALLTPPYRPNRLIYIPPEIRHVEVTEASPWLTRPTSETPRPFPVCSNADQFSQLQETPMNVFLHTSAMRTPAIAPNSLVGYTPSSMRRREPGVGETLLGCATLLLVGIILLAILYYIAM